MANGFGTFRIIKAEVPTPSGIEIVRPGIGTNVAELVVWVPLVCAYRLMIAFLLF
jgi:hypothetical protein